MSFAEADSETFIDQAAACVAEILELSLLRSPLPTPNSTIDKELSRSFPEGFQPFRAIRTQFGETDVWIAVTLRFLSNQKITSYDIDEIERLASRYTLNTILVPYFDASNDTALHAVGSRSPVRLVRLAPPRFVSGFSTGEYHSVPRFSQGVINRANIVSAALLKQLRKTSHIVLSDIAAPNYDKDYAKSSAGTAFAMNEEVHILDKFVLTLPRRSRAIELGCGTGRHALELAKTFDEVQGYDFSSDMIDIAQDKKTHREFRDVRFKTEFFTRDIEMHPPALADESVDLFAGLFGMGSFVENIVEFLDVYYRMLASDGGVIFSFYNKDALIYVAPPPWRYPAISARLEIDRDELVVTLPSGQTFRIYCRAYSPKYLRELFERFFTDVRLYTFPIISGFLPKDYIDTFRPGSESWELVHSLDSILVRSNPPEVGNYVVVTARKAKLRSGPAFSMDEPFDLLAAKSLSPESHCQRVEHPPFRTGSEITNSLGIQLPFVRSILIYRVINTAGVENRYPILCVTRVGTKISLEKLQSVLGGPGTLRLATSDEASKEMGSEYTPLPIVGMSSVSAIVVSKEVVGLREFVMASGKAGTSYHVKGKILIPGATIENVTS